MKFMSFDCILNFNFLLPLYWLVPYDALSSAVIWLVIFMVRRLFWKSFTFNSMGAFLHICNNGSFEVYIAKLHYVRLPLDCSDWPMSISVALLSCACSCSSLEFLQLQVDTLSFSIRFLWMSLKGVWFFQLCLARSQNYYVGLFGEWCRNVETIECWNTEAVV